MHNAPSGKTLGGHRHKLVAVVVVGSALVIAACGSASKPSTAATSVSSTAVRFADCMRSHGLPSFPDPSPGGSTSRASIRGRPRSSQPTRRVATATGEHRAGLARLRGASGSRRSRTRDACAPTAFRTFATRRSYPAAATPSALKASTPSPQRSSRPRPTARGRRARDPDVKWLVSSQDFGPPARGSDPPNPLKGAAGRIDRRFRCSWPRMAGSVRRGRQRGARLVLYVLDDGQRPDAVARHPQQL